MGAGFRAGGSGSAAHCTRTKRRIAMTGARRACLRFLFSPRMPTHADPCPRMPTHASAGRCMPTPCHATACQPMQAQATACQPKAPMPTHAMPLHANPCKSARVQKESPLQEQESPVPNSRSRVLKRHESSAERHESSAEPPVLKGPRLFSTARVHGQSRLTARPDFCGGVHAP